MSEKSESTGIAEKIAAHNYDTAVSSAITSVERERTERELAAEKPLTQADYDALYDEIAAKDAGIDRSKLVGRVTVAAALAATISAAPAIAGNNDALALPDPTPIVQMVSLDDPDDGGATVDDEQNQHHSSKLLLKILGLILALLVAAGGALLGAAKCTGSLPFGIGDGDNQQQSQTA